MGRHHEQPIQRTITDGGLPTVWSPARTSEYLARARLTVRRALGWTRSVKFAMTHEVRKTLPRVPGCRFYSRVVASLLPTQFTPCIRSRPSFEKTFQVTIDRSYSRGSRAGKLNEVSPAWPCSESGRPLHPEESRRTGGSRPRAWHRVPDADQTPIGHGGPWVLVPSPLDISYKYFAPSVTLTGVIPILVFLFCEVLSRLCLIFAIRQP